uniref:Uncharacterized protein n=1 Tax=Mustela putorius furo TaxID=9669 RepID=M3Y5F2_MUSPF
MCRGVANSGAGRGLGGRSGVELGGGGPAWARPPRTARVEPDEDTARRWSSMKKPASVLQAPNLSTP